MRLERRHVFVKQLDMNLSLSRIFSKFMEKLRKLNLGSLITISMTVFKTTTTTGAEMFLCVRKLRLRIIVR